MGEELINTPTFDDTQYAIAAKGLIGIGKDGRNFPKPALTQ